MFDILELQKKLVRAALPSGFERPQAEVLRELARPFVDEITTDTLGNVICHKKGKGKKIMFPAHMDVLGMMITYIDDNGFLRFAPIGGHSPARLISSNVRLENGLAGCISADRSVSKDNYCDIDCDDLYIDIGAESREQAEQLAPVGSVCTFEADSVEIAGGCMMTPYADDMTGCISLLLAMEQLKDKECPNDLYFVFTVQEEVGTRGANSAAFCLEPDLCIAVDVTATGDTPGEIDGQRMRVSVGAGPAVKIKDYGMIANIPAVRHLEEAAEEAGISTQREILVGGSTDAAEAQISRAGILSGCISIPCRNIHSPAEIVSLEDVRQTAGLVAAAAMKKF